METSPDPLLGYPSDQLYDEALRLAHRIAGFATSNVRASRALVRASVTHDLDATLRAGYAAFRPVRAARMAQPPEY